MMMKLLKVKQHQPKITMNCKASICISIISTFLPKYIHKHQQHCILFVLYRLVCCIHFINCFDFFVRNFSFFFLSFIIYLVLLLSNLCFFAGKKKITILANLMKWKKKKKTKPISMHFLKHFTVTIYFANCLDLFDAKIFNKIKIGCKY